MFSSKENQLEDRQNSTERTSQNIVEPAGQETFKALCHFAVSSNTGQENPHGEESARVLAGTSSDLCQNFTENEKTNDQDRVDAEEITTNQLKTNTCCTSVQEAQLPDANNPHCTANPGFVTIRVGDESDEKASRPVNEVQLLSQPSGETKHDLLPLSGDICSQAVPPLIESVLKIEIKVEDDKVQDLYVPASVIQQGKTFIPNAVDLYNTAVIGTLDRDMSRAVETAVNFIANGFQVVKPSETYLKYSCDACELSFTQEEQLENHRKIHGEKKIFPCDFCGKVLYVKSKYLVHRRNHTGEKPFKCEFCDSVFSRNSSLNRHRKCHTGSAVYKCEKCNLMLDYSQFTAHRKLHSMNRQCTVCNKAFIKHSDLVRHFRIHTGEKPHKCEICGRGFSDKSHLTTHVRIHTGERPYKCDTCKKAFLKNSDLVRHKRVHASGRSSYCDICGSSFHSNFLMLNHKRTHNSESMMKCGVCGKEYSENSNPCEHDSIAVPV